jgi:hypothetical protein
MKEDLVTQLINISTAENVAIHELVSTICTVVGLKCNLSLMAAIPTARLVSYKMVVG